MVGLFILKYWYFGWGFIGKVKRLKIKRREKELVIVDRK